MVRVWYVLLLLIVGVSDMLAGIGTWKTYTSKREVRDIAENNGVLWTATSGGLFSFRSSDSSFTELTTSEGLRTIDLTAVAADAGGNIWIGAANGSLHRFAPSTGLWNYIMDIAIRTDPNKRINALSVSGDTLFILSDIGLSIFSVSNMEFGDTYTRFGDSTGQIAGNVTSMILYNGKRWVGTRNGVASTPLSNIHPSAPESWEVFTTIQGLPSNRINGMAVMNDTLFAATSAGLSFFNGVSWSTVNGTSGLNVLDLVSESGISFITLNELRVYGGNSSGAITSGFQSNLTVIGSSSVVGSLSAGLLVRSGNSWQSVVPDCPSSNKFVGIAVDQRGNVWSGTGASNADGFMSFDGMSWKSYTVASDARLGTNNYFKVSIGSNNTKWVSSWGAGVALVDDNGVVQKILNTTNGLPPSLAIDPFFVVVGGVATDRNGIAWITNRTGPNDTAVVLFHPDSSLSYISNLRMRTPENVFTDVVIDFNGTKWFSNFSRFEPAAPVGFYYYNELVTVPGTTNGWGKLTTADGLTSDKVYSVAVDHDGALWAGSDQGISIIFNPSNPRSQIAAYHPLRDQIIQAIVVDALNNKWVATRQGVFLLSPDGTTIIERYTVENTAGKLLDNDVASMAVNNATGVMYFGTEKGLSSLSTTSMTPSRSFSGLSFTPNPYYLPSSAAMTVDGLVEGSNLKILGIDGKLIREIKTPGGRIGFWDGKDEKGQLVSSAIYLVVAYSEDGSKVATGKVAVIRR